MQFTKQNEIETIPETVSEINDRVKLSAKKQDAQYADLIMVLHGLETKIDRILSIQESERSQIPAMRVAMEEEYEKAKELVVDIGKVSASYLQKGLGIGHTKALKLIELLEQRGVIGQKKENDEIEEQDSSSVALSPDDIKKIPPKNRKRSVPIERKLGARYAQTAHIIKTLNEKVVVAPLKRIRQPRKSE